MKYPIIKRTLTTDVATYNIETMGDMTHVMVNLFCYHIAQIKTPELLDECIKMMMEAKREAQAETHFGISIDTENIETDYSAQ